MTFAAQLQAARITAGLSQSQAALPLIEAQIIGSVRTLQNWEAGRGETLPAYKQAAALAALRPQKKARSRKGQRGSQKPNTARHNELHHKRNPR